MNLSKIEIITEETTDTDLSSRVVLYNDDSHTFDEVIVQLIIAIKCTYEQARNFAFEVHVKGKAIVFYGSLNNCLKVSSSPGRNCTTHPNSYLVKQLTYSDLFSQSEQEQY